MMDIKKLREICDKATPDEFIAAARTALPEALDEIGRLRKALDLAVEELELYAPDCPGFLYGWGGCEDLEECRGGILTEKDCWRRYFLEKAQDLQP